MSAILKCLSFSYKDNIIYEDVSERSKQPLEICRTLDHVQNTKWFKHGNSGCLTIPQALWFMALERNRDMGRQ